MCIRDSFHLPSILGWWIFRWINQKTPRKFLACSITSRSDILRPNRAPLFDTLKLPSPSTNPTNQASSSEYVLNPSNRSPFHIGSYILCCHDVKDYRHTVVLVTFCCRPLDEVSER